MTRLPLRPLEITGEGAAAYDTRLTELEGQLADPARDRNDLVREALREIYFPGPAGGRRRVPAPRRNPRRARDARSALGHDGTRVLPRHRPGALFRAQAADLVLADVRSLRAGRKRPPRRPPATPTGPHVFNSIPTILEDNVRISYGAVVLAGVRVGVQGPVMVGARAVATRSVRPYHVNIGIPAKSVRVKSIAPRGTTRDANVPDRDHR